MDVTGRFGMINTPNTSNIMEEIYNFDKITPYAAPFINPNGSYAYAYNTKESLPTLNARLALSGYTRTKQNDLNILLGGTQKLDAVLRGLSLTGRVAYASTWDVWRKLLRDLPPSYHYDAATGQYNIDPRGRYSMPTYAVSAGSEISDKRVNIQAILNYDRIFGDHQVRGMVLFNQNSYTFKNNVPENFRGYSLSAGYNFQRKYLLDVNMGYNGSDRFAGNKRLWIVPRSIGRLEYRRRAFLLKDCSPPSNCSSSVQVMVWWAPMPWMATAIFMSRYMFPAPIIPSANLLL